MILIVGASGFLGRETAKQLLSGRHPVRVMVRTPEKVNDLMALGADVVQGDLIDPASLQRACQGVDQVFAAAHSLIGKGRYRSEAVDGAGHRDLIDAAKAAGVKHFVYTSVLGASPDHPVDFWRTKYQVEQYLKASGLPFTILRPTAFMEWHVHIFNGKSILERGKTSLLGRGTKVRNFIAVRDVARFAVQALTGPALKNRMLELGGPDNLSNNEVAARYGRIAGIEPRISYLPPAAAGFLGKVLKPFHPGLSRIMYLNSLRDDAFNEVFDPGALLAEFPGRLTGVEEFVRERVAAHNAQGVR